MRLGNFDVLRVRTGRDYVRNGCARNNYCDSGDRVARASRVKRVSQQQDLLAECKGLVYKKGMSRTFYSLRRIREFSSRLPAPLTREDAGLVSCPVLLHLSSGIFALVATTPISFETYQAVRLYGVNHGSI
jgi:hypothetical protein